MNSDYFEKYSFHINNDFFQEKKASLI